MREDYSSSGDAWTHFPHEHARSRAYRWGEDGLAGISDNHGKMCFSVALWNEKDPILKERMFGTTGHQGELIGLSAQSVPWLILNPKVITERMSRNCTGTWTLLQLTRT